MNDVSPFIGGQLAQHDLTPLNAPGSFSDWVLRAVNGELDLSLSGITGTALRYFADELFLNGALIRQLLVIAVLSALVRCLSDSFKNKSVGELAFYVHYILMVSVAVASFTLCAGILTGLVLQITGMMEAAVPLIISLMALSGNFAGAAVFHPLVLMGTTLMARFVGYVFIPLVTASAVLHMVNHLTENGVFTKFSELLKKTADVLLKFLVFAFLALLAVQKVSVPIMNNFALRTARAAAGAVPVVGGALNSAMDTVLSVGSAAQRGVLVALVIVLTLTVSVPLLKLLAFMFVYRLTAALVQPICDDRVVKCLDGVGGYTGLLLGAGALVSLMFICSCVILLVM
jgi:stage III sporulation protein AE